MQTRPLLQQWAMYFWLILLAGSGIPQSTKGEETMDLTIKSAAFEPGGEIPAEYTCDDRDISPPLEWTGIPPNAGSLALIVDDPDAPDPNAPRMTWVHWVVYNLSPQSLGLAAGDDPDGLPAGAKQGQNDWQRSSYGGPCPPIGRHRYFFKLYALDRMLEDLGSPTKPQLEAAMRGHVLARGELVGTYQKRR